MNRVILMGRLTRDPEARYTKDQMCVARYTLAVDRRGTAGNGQAADFIGCVAFGKNGEFAEKYLQKGVKIVVTGRIQTGSYTNRDGQKVYTTDVIVEEQEFAESKKATEEMQGQQKRSGSEQDRPQIDDSGFVNIPDGIDDMLPFN